MLPSLSAGALRTAHLCHDVRQARGGPCAGVYASAVHAGGHARNALAWAPVEPNGQSRPRELTTNPRAHPQHQDLTQQLTEVHQMLQLELLAPLPEHVCGVVGPVLPLSPVCEPSVQLRRQTTEKEGCDAPPELPPLAVENLIDYSSAVRCYVHLRDTNSLDESAKQRREQAGEASQAAFANAGAQVGFILANSVREAADTAETGPASSWSTRGAGLGGLLQ